MIYLTGMSLLKLPVDLFKTVTKLEYLDIQSNELTRLDKNLLRENVNLISFTADYNLVEYLHRSLFRNNAKLTSIYLSNNRIKSLAKGLFRNLAKLEKLDLSFNYIASISSDSFEGVYDDLEYLFLNENGFDFKTGNFTIDNDLPGRQKIFSSGTEYSEMEKVEFMNNHRKLNENKIQEKHQRTDPSKCGRKFKSAGLIVNGTASGVNEWPWLTSLVRSPFKEFFCAGSIVSEHHVLTAAHCLHNKHRGQAVLKPTEFLVYLGKHNLSALEENSQWFHPHEVLVHPDWATENIRYDADLAIVVSNFPIPFSSTIAPVCLWTELEEDGNFFGTVVGWGASEKTGLTGHTDVPYQVEVRRVPSAKCYEDQHLLAMIGSSRSFCARGVAEYSGPCNGDSGGGFFLELNGVWFLQGIVSSTMISNTLTCDVSKYALYTKINEFLSWINLRNKAYDIRLRGGLTFPREREDWSTFITSGLDVTQPSANVILDWKNSMLKVDEVILSNRNVFFLPNGFGRIFPTMERFEIEYSNLRFVERENFEGMKDLRVLIIYSNPIKNLPGDAFSELTGLSELSITRTQIALLQSNLLHNNSQLISLTLSYNQIESLPNGLLKNNLELKTIDLYYNKIKIITADNFKNLPKFEEISLENNRIQNISPESFVSLPNLKIVRLDKNRMKTLHVETFTENTELTHFRLTSNLIDNFPSTLLRNNKKLEILKLSSNKIREFSFLKNLKNLDSLELDSTNIKVLPRDLFYALTSLRFLRISDNEIETLDRDLLSKNEELQEFFASFNKIRELHPKLFQRNVKLDNIDLGSNRLTSINSELLKNLTKLSELNFNFNLIESIDVDTFSDLTSLRRLFITDNNLKHLHENLFSSLTELNDLEISSNLIEYLPSGLFRNNKNLEWIDFNYNNLKTIDLEFNPNRGYRQLWFFENTCVNIGFKAGRVDYDDVDWEAKETNMIEETIREIVKNCSDKKIVVDQKT